MTQEEKNNKLQDAVRNNDTEAVRESLELGADPNVLPSCGTPLLMTAVNTRSTESGIIVKMLLGAGADINIKDWRGRTAVVYAALNGNIGAFTVLIQASNKADTGKTQDQRTIALHQARVAMHIFRSLYPKRYGQCIFRKLLEHEDTNCDLPGSDPDFNI